MGQFYTLNFLASFGSNCIAGSIEQAYIDSRGYGDNSCYKNGPGTVLHCDMQTFTELQDGDRIVVKKSIHKAKMLHQNLRLFFTVEEKLRWNINPQRIGSNPQNNNPYVKKFRNLELCLC